MNRAINLIVLLFALVTVSPAGEPPKLVWNPSGLNPDWETYVYPELFELIASDLSGDFVISPSEDGRWSGGCGQMNFGSYPGKDQKNDISSGYYKGFTHEVIHGLIDCYWLNDNSQDEGIVQALVGVVYERLREKYPDKFPNATTWRWASGALNNLPFLVTGGSNFYGSNHSFDYAGVAGSYERVIELIGGSLAFTSALAEEYDKQAPMPLSRAQVHSIVDLLADGRTIDGVKPSIYLNRISTAFTSNSRVRWDVTDGVHIGATVICPFTGSLSMINPCSSFTATYYKRETREVINDGTHYLTSRVDIPLSGKAECIVTGPAGVLFTKQVEINWGSFSIFLPPLSDGRDRTWPEKNGVYTWSCRITEGEQPTDREWSLPTHFIQYGYDPFLPNQGFSRIPWKEEKMFVILNPGYTGFGDSSSYEVVDPEGLVIERYNSLLVINLNGYRGEVVVRDTRSGKTRTFSTYSKLTSIQYWDLSTRPPVVVSVVDAAFATEVDPRVLMELAPGELATLFGVGLSDNAPTFATSIPLSFEGCAGTHGVTKVFVTDSLGVRHRAPFLYCSGNQINFQVPTGAALGDGFVTVIRNNSEESRPFPIMIVPAKPAIFIARRAVGPFDKDIPAVINAGSGRMVTSDYPALPGDIISVFPTGLGLTDPIVETGQTYWGPASTVTPFKVTIDGIACEVLYAGIAPGFVGLNQINCVIPHGLKGGLGEMKITNTANSNVVYIALQPEGWAP